MTIIKNKVAKCFTDFKEALENQIEEHDAIKGLVRGLVDIADKSIHSQYNRDLLDKAIEDEFNQLDGD